MQPSRFDRLTRRLAVHASRRVVLGSVLAGLVAVPARRAGAAQDATPSPAGGEPSFLFVQTALSGTFAPNPSAGTHVAAGTPTSGGGATYLLTLEGHHGETIFFSDRPDRIFGEAPPQAFLDGLGFTPTNPPNAALVAETSDGEEVVVLELITPAFDAERGTLTYGAEILAEYAGEGLAPVAGDDHATSLPEQFGHASLFIDDCPDITTCYAMNADSFTPPTALGPIPGGPCGSCWDLGEFSCQPCHERRGVLEQRCDDTYHCGRACWVGA
jgi:hypothetical protein